MTKKETTIFVVIPTIRDLNFLKSWGKEFSKCHLIVVEDRDDSRIKIPNKNFLSITHYSRKDIDKDLGINSWIISRHNAGIRCYGFWKAYKKGADVIITIDDDCYQTTDSFVKGHLDNLRYKTPYRWTTTYPDPKWAHTRGIPYKVRNKGLVSISHGLWSGALDLDGRTESKLPHLLNEDKYPSIRQIVPLGYFYPMCSMNLAFTRKVVPLMFFPMMGEDPTGNAWPYNRYDDIWAGIFSKKIMDHLGLGVINGSPFINHKKASKPKENHKKEVSGMKMNERLWHLVDAVKLTKDNPKDCYIELAKKIKFPNSNYFKNLKKAMIIWSDLF